MKVLAIYAVNEHINQLMIDAQRARMAREANPRPSLVRRAASAARAAFARRSPQTAGAAA